ncbi:uncharacterized protein PRCAT00001780001 [Priceomyces carsonii]|uniref:uncharacterized protein n=1 Tax=Priceomyces carsonii TaxID=28549 RepID=UPI002EDAEC63|nr:unnamed protein product [Priceomyces carsonii]
MSSNNNEQNFQSQSSYLDVPLDYESLLSSRMMTSMGITNNEQSLKKVFSDLCLACRSGDLETADSLLSTPSLDINQVDEWDYSPLILASICGHTKIVELLLSRGAVCDRDTFQGARCIYGALNDEIRDLLVSFDISKSVDLSQPFASHISSLLNTTSEIKTTDIAFYFPYAKTSNGESRVFALNRFLMAARSPYFRQKFQGEWKNLTVVEVQLDVDPIAFKAIVNYVYLKTDAIPVDQVDVRTNLRKLAIRYNLDDLLKGIDMISKAEDDKHRAKIKHEMSFIFVEKARKDMDSFLEKHVVRNKLRIDLNLSTEADSEDFDVRMHIQNELKQKLLDSSAIPDIILAAIDEETESIVFYPTNKPIIARSEYFDTMMKSDIFKSSLRDPPLHKSKINQLSWLVIDRVSLNHQDIPVIQISSSCTDEQVAEIILSFFYHDDVKQIPLHLSVELLFAADELFLDRLKTMAAVKITSSVSQLTYDEFKSLADSFGYDAYDLIRVAWNINCEKLEQHMTKLIAHNLETIYHNHEEKKRFSSLIKESASRIEERQDTDTIELIDDIRYYLGKKYAIGDLFKDFEDLGPTIGGTKGSEDILILKKSIKMYDRENEMIDLLLEELALDA